MITNLKLTLNKKSQLILECSKKISDEELKKSYYKLFKELEKQKLNDYLYIEK